MNLYQFFNNDNESILILAVNHQKAVEYAKKKDYFDCRFVGKVKTEETYTREVRIV